VEVATWIPNKLILFVELVLADIAEHLIKSSKWVIALNVRKLAHFDAHV
jgi:hypothetical protein